MKILNAFIAPSEMMSLLDKWHKALREYNFKESASLKRKIDPKMAVFEVDENMNILVYYSLIRSREALLKGDIETAELTLKEVQGNITNNDYYTFYFLFIKGLVKVKKRAYHEGLELYLEAMNYLESLENQYEIADFHYKLASVYYYVEDTYNSLRTLETSLNIYRDYDPIRLADCELLQGLNCIDLKLYEDAEEYFHSALNHVVDKGNKELTGSLYHNLGLLYSEQKLSDTAITYLTKVITKIPSHSDHMQSIFLVCREYSRKGDYTEAEKYGKRGLSLAKKKDDSFYIHKFYTLIESFKQTDEFENTFQTALLYFKENRHNYEYKLSLEMLAEYHYNKSEFEKSSYFFRESLSVNNS